MAQPAAPEAPERLEPLQRRVPLASNPPLPESGRPASQGPLADPVHGGMTPSGAPQQPGPVDPPQSGWYSAGDDGWRAAQAAREPSSGGTTTAGLPRRGPRANHVPGGVSDPARGRGAAVPQQSGAPGGAVPGNMDPGVSRSPEDVRGRLTSFRRGIQQGRTAGAGGTAPRPRDENNQEQA
jgi:hypothetical protein